MQRSSRRSVRLAFVLIFGSYALFGLLAWWTNHLDQQQAQEVAVDLAQSACDNRNDFRDALHEVFVHVDELVAEAGNNSGLSLVDEFAHVTEHEACDEIDASPLTPQGEP